jgi:hypothetical protein
MKAVFIPEQVITAVIVTDKTDIYHMPASCGVNRIRNKSKFIYCYINIYPLSKFPSKGFIKCSPIITPASRKKPVNIIILFMGNE